MNKKIRSLRAYAGVSQTELARALSLSQATISRIETGMIIPSRELASRIVNFLIQASNP